MHKKIIFLFLMVSTLCTVVFAYNPPASGELLYQLSIPEALSGGASTAGGGLANEQTAQIVINPALLATEQRMVGNVAYTALYNGSDDVSYGQSIYGGLVYPTKYGVLTGSLQYVNIPVSSVLLENNFTIRGAFSKDVEENLFVGAGLYGGFGSDWSLGLDLGFVYSIGTIKKIPVLSNVRWGGALTGIGKTYDPDTTGYIDNNEDSTGFPSLSTLRTGLAATFLDLEKIKGGFSTDIAFPTFQNVIFDSGLQFEIAGFLYIDTGWEFNLLETLEGVGSYLPSISLSVKLGFASDNDSYLGERGWSENEIVPSVAYRQLTNNTQVVSGGASFYLGLPDTEAPEIELWEE